jgi:hypothetical protein
MVDRVFALAPAIARVASLVVPLLLVSCSPKVIDRTAWSMEGRYWINGEAEQVVIVTRLGLNQYRVERPGEWVGLGFFDGQDYAGVFYYPDDTTWGELAGAMGEHRGRLQGNGQFRIRGEFTKGSQSAFELFWVPAPEGRR